MFASVDVDTGRIVQCNRTLADAMRYTREELLRQTLSQLHSPASERPLAEAVERIRETGRVRDIDLELRRKDGGPVNLTNDVHDLAYQFHPSILDDLGLTAALSDDFRRREGIEVDVAHAVPDEIAPEIAYCLYRVTRESVRNVAVHAGSPRVALSLRAIDGGLRLVIEDFGVGFEPGDTAGDRPGLGVIGMQERVRLAGGRFQVTSNIGKGTRVEAWVPVAREGS